MFQCLGVQLQSLACLPPVSGPCQKSGGANPLAFRQPRGSCPIPGQDYRDAGPDRPGRAGLFLPGTMLQPEPAQRNAGGSLRGSIQRDNHAGQLAMIALRQRAQLAASSLLSLDLASGEAAVTASSRRMLR